MNEYINVPYSPLRTVRSTFFYENENQSVNLHGCLIIIISSPKH